MAATVALKCWSAATHSVATLQKLFLNCKFRRIFVAQTVINSVRFEVLMAVTMKNAVFWDVVLCKFTISTHRRIPEDGNLHCY
jgi:hypothetical protein